MNAKSEMTQILVDMMMQVPGEHKKVSPRAMNYFQDNFAYAGTTEFEGRKVMFIAEFAKNGNAYEPKVYDLTYYNDLMLSKKLNAYFTNVQVREYQYHWLKSVTKDLGVKLRSVNCHEFSKYEISHNYSFMYNDFYNMPEPRLAQFLALFKEIKPKANRIVFEPKTENEYLADLTPAEIKQAEQTTLVPKIKASDPEKVAKTFLSDLARVYTKVETPLVSNIFDADTFLTKDCKRATLAELRFKTVYYQAGKRAIKFDYYDADDKAFPVTIYRTHGAVSEYDAVRLTGTLYELEYGLKMYAAKINRPKIDQYEAKTPVNQRDSFMQCFNRDYTITQIDMTKIINEQECKQIA